jgi:serine/threonine protein phosphatase PrpC
MSVIRRLFRSLYEKIFLQKRERTFNEQPTRPLDAAALAKALAGEGRRHISTGRARYVLSDSTGSKETLYLLMAHSDGLHALPDFGMIGLAASVDTEVGKRNLSNVALTVFANQLTKKAILDFLELEGFEDTTPLQNMVADAANFADQTIYESNQGMGYSLTAGIIFAEILILGHRGNTCAYQIDRHHIERITIPDWNTVERYQTKHSQTKEGSISTEESGQPAESYGPFTIYSRPVPRDGYILLCSEGLWRNVSEKTIYDIVMREEEPQRSCDALIARVRKQNVIQNVSVILLYFPPDFGPWR